MSGTVAGGRKARDTVKKLYGEDFFRMIGKAGGLKQTGGGFASDKVGKDGLTGVERARIAGKRGGMTPRKSRHE